MNVVNGGMHAMNSIDFQEYMLMPIGASTFSEALQWGAETYHALKNLLAKRGSRRSWATRAVSSGPADNETAVKVLVEAIESTGRTPDATSPSRWIRRRRSSTATAPITSTAKVECCRVMRWSTTGSTSSVAIDRLARRRMAEQDWDGWAKLTTRLGEKLQLVVTTTS